MLLEKKVPVAAPALISTPLPAPAK